MVVIKHYVNKNIMIKGNYFEHNEIELKSLDWWQSLDCKEQSNFITDYYIKNKIGLNLKEVVKLYKKQNGVVDTTKRKRERIKVKNNNQNI